MDTMIKLEGEKMDANQVITDFVSIAIQSGGWMDLDRIYLQNRLMSLVGQSSFEEGDTKRDTLTSIELLDELIEIAINNHVIESRDIGAIERLSAKITDILTPPPSVINALFSKQYESSPKEATDYFYTISRMNDYIKTRDIAKNISYTHHTNYGELEITINLSKPEKDPKDIALSRQAETIDYPLCHLCMENEGYEGRVNHPARTNHRIIRMNLNGDSWGFQYSPYAYFNEHCIFLSEKHEPMTISRASFDRLLQIVDIFPHYFVGSNADLPIVGGSILSHDHFQGGNHAFPMAKAEIDYTFNIPGFKSVKAGIVKWPMSVIRLQSTSKQDILNVAEYVTLKWKQFSYPSLDILAKTEDGVEHHTVTPIVRKVDNMYEFDLVLRDNNVSVAFPDGIFHPHPELHHIKKENIGLIEVMGLAILPPRLKNELENVKEFLLGREAKVADYHLEWAKEMKKTQDITSDTVDKVIEMEVGKIFEQVLLDAGVFKKDQQGEKAFLEFTRTL